MLQNIEGAFKSITKCCKKWGHFVQNLLFLTPNIFEDRKIQFLVPKYFLQKMLQKRGGHFVQNSLLFIQGYGFTYKITIPRYKQLLGIQKYRRIPISNIFPTKNVAKIFLGIEVTKWSNLHIRWGGINCKENTVVLAYYGSK